MEQAHGLPCACFDRGGAMKNRHVQRLLFLAASAAVLTACLLIGTPDSGVPEEAISAGDTPFYTFYDGAGNLQLELYLDPETGQGRGTRHVRREGEAGLWEYTYSFTLAGENSMGEPAFFPDKAYVGSCLGTDGSELVEDYRESWEYREDGQPLRFYAQGVSDDPQLAAPTDVVTVDFFYRQDGSLCRKHYWHNTYLMGTTGSPADIFYDALERPVYAECYITHGSLEYYYLYAADSLEPEGCLCLDFFGEDCLAELHWLSHRRPSAEDPKAE